MRTDLTVRSGDGTEHDVAIIAPQGTTFGAVARVLARVVAAVPTWVGARRIDVGAIVGGDALVTGAVLSAVRHDDEPQPRGVRLEIVGGARCGHAVPLSRGEIDIGRDAACTLALDDPQVSRRHAVVTATPSAVRIRDLDSTHGTYVGGERIDPGCVLAAETPVRIGDTTLMLRAGVTEQQEAPADEARLVVLPSTPDVVATQHIQWAAALVPAVAGAAFAVLMHSMQFLAFAALSPLALLLGAFGDRWHGRRLARKARASYRDERAQADGEVAEALQHEVAQRRLAHSDAGSVLRSPTTHWRRGRGLQVRVGLADLPSTTAVRDGAGTRPAATLHAVPYVVDLADAPMTIVAAPHLRHALARWLIVQLATRDSPADLEFALFTTRAQHWRWMRWLPQLRGRIACTEREHRSLMADVVELADGRRGASSAWSGRWLMLILDGTIPATAGLDAVLADGAAVGVTALCLDEHAHTTPRTAHTTLVRAAHGTAGTVRVGATTVLADGIDLATAERIARALAPVAHGDTGREPPDAAELAALLGDDPICVDAITSRWRRAEPTARTVIGTGAQGPVSIDLDRDGPHALIAGTTGSGKSELLQTLVVGLAAHYPPDEITFLLVDYKGGAAFAQCAELPHTVGVVTDLDERLTRRVLASLDSEIRRREALLAAAQAPDRATYCDRRQRLPRLVLLVDEFATLADELPRFVPGLVSIAQRGRSLGVHLVLATQRPAGAVSPQIRANTALRIALRTTSAAESIDVIDAPDAAGIDRHTPGRAYLRAGTTTVAVQCARVTGPSSPSGIAVAALDEWRRLPSGQRSDEESALSKYLSAIRVAARDHPAPERPWLPPLPSTIRLDDLVPPQGGIAFGLVDLPAEQRQQPLTLDLAQGHTVLVTGSACSGRSNALLALALAAARTHPPDEVHVHAIDCGGAAFGELDRLPHLGARLALRGGVELVARLLVLLERAAACRKFPAASTPAILLLVDGWEELVAASDEHDSGRTIDRLLALVRCAPSARITIAISGGRATLAPRVAGAFGTRYVLRMHDPGDYAQAGVGAESFPDPASPGRGVRVADGAEVQFALAQPVPRLPQSRPAPTTAPLRVRPLPHRVTLRELADSGATTLGVGGDAALPIAVDLAGGSGRMLIAGPARSGRSTLLRTILAQDRDGPPVIAAPTRSPLAAAARERDLRLITPSDAPGGIDPDALLLVDDCEAFADTAAGAALHGWLVTTGRRAVVGGRSDAIALDYRGLAAEIRRCGCGVLLRPGPLDGELLGARLPAGRTELPPGRGMLVPDPAWRLGSEPLPIQVAEV